MREKKVLVHKIHRMLIRRATPDGKLERSRLFEIIAERVGKISPQEKEVLVIELKSEGVIVEANKDSFVLAKVELI